MASIQHRFRSSSVPSGLRRVLVANRGEIACRIIRTLDLMGIESVAVYSEADRGARHVRDATISVAIGPSPASESYLSASKILAVASRYGVDGVHPGYGFLSENADFARSVEAAGMAFCGPTPAQIEAFGRKDSARALALAAGVPLLPGSDPVPDVEVALVESERIGYPVMLKSTAGGGGIGMAICSDPSGMAEQYERVVRTSQASFGSASVYVERFVRHARHVEVQVFGDGQGHVVALGERDCSMQRRNQKVMEETPAPGLGDGLRRRLSDWAVRLAAAADYRSAGTVEFLLDAATGDAFFLEVNTRLQVEHPVTEAVFGIDLVEWMVALAGGTSRLTTWTTRPPVGHAIEARLYAEDPARGYRPSSGLITRVSFPVTARVDTAIEAGTDVSPYYDPLIAKVVVHGIDRRDALERIRGALQLTEVHGVQTNLDLLRAIVEAGPFADGNPTTAAVAEIDLRLATVEVLAGGLMSTLQDLPGRLGYWGVGVPPSGPMDSLSLRAVNEIVGNDPGEAALEMTRVGATLRFDTACEVALGGAVMAADLDGEPVVWRRSFAAAAGQTLTLGAVQGPGARTYLAISGGFDVPSYLGSRSTFTMGGFGGHGGRALRAGDILRLGLRPKRPAVPSPAQPSLTSKWELDVRYGPHAAPDFFEADYLDQFFATSWTVHHNSDRTGVRLVGPRPGWARVDGGDAGLHPSNIHDTPYSVGAVDFTGDMPVILGPDGPSLGGFVCPVTLTNDDLWKLGQLSPGDIVRFRLAGAASAVLATRPANRGVPEVVYRRSGDDNILVEYGPPVLDLGLRLRAHELMQRLARGGPAGIVDLTPGIRSLQVHFDHDRVSGDAILDWLQAAEADLPAVDALEVPSRIIHLPLSWEDPAALLAVERYMNSVRPDAPWCPSNTEFIRRVNGLGSVEDVKAIVYAASYLVLGLGDVYLGAPVATPIDPRHRLVTTKYNPARTWTPENAVGIGGAYMCVYGMEGPGGYQLVGRTVPVWNTHRVTDQFTEGTPWLLRYFDQIRFFPVEADELMEWRLGVRNGTRALDIEETTFSYSQHRRCLDEIASEATAFRTSQQAAFAAERERWGDEPAPENRTFEVREEANEDGEPVTAMLAANVLAVRVEDGNGVEAGEVIAILEAMKMEVQVTAHVSGTVTGVRCAPGDVVVPGQTLLTIRTGEGE